MICPLREGQAIAHSICWMRGVSDTQALKLFLLCAMLEVVLLYEASARLEEPCLSRGDVLLSAALPGCFLTALVQTVHITFNVLLVLGLGCLVINTEDLGKDVVSLRQFEEGSKIACRSERKGEISPSVTAELHPAQEGSAGFVPYESSSYHM